MLDLSSRDQLVNYLKLHNLWLDKKSGQHFLVDGAVLDKIIASAELTGSETIVEIGPGVGTLTQRLGAAVPKGLVLAIERDPRLVHLLREFFDDSQNIKVVHEDVLRYDVREIERPYRVIANLPYQVTGAILRLFVRFDEYAPESLILMMQREVADRLLAPPGTSERGILTVLRELFGEAELVTTVPPESFFPPPQVNSAVIKITRHKKPMGGIAPEALLAIARAGFAAKRRTLANALHGSLRLPKDQVGEILTRAGVPALHRAEDLALPDWVRLAGELESRVS